MRYPVTLLHGVNLSKILRFAVGGEKVRAVKSAHLQLVENYSLLNIKSLSAGEKWLMLEKVLRWNNLNSPTASVHSLIPRRKLSF